MGIPIDMGILDKLCGGREAAGGMVHDPVRGTAIRPAARRRADPDA